MTRRSSRRQGFTLLEVMMTLSIMMVALMGIVALERAAVRANIEARATSVAATNNARWASILRREALAWTTDANTTSTVSIIAAGAGAPNTWIIPTPTAPDTIGLDWFGQPTSVAANIRYCTVLRFRDVVANVSARVEVVTFWAGSANATSSASATFGTLCANGQGAAAGDALFGATPDARLRHVRSTVVLRSTRP